MKTTVKETKQNTAYIDFLVTQKEVLSAKTDTIKNLSVNTQIRGFRKGKAPLELVERHLDPEKVNHQTLHLLLDKYVPEAIKSEKLTLVGNPQLVNLTTPADKDWQFTVAFPLLPVIELGDYESKVKEALAKADAGKLTQDQRFEIVGKVLLENINFEVSSLLVDQEVERSLARLVEQVQTLGLTVEKYLASINKSVEQLKQEYETSATNSLKMEFILLEIARSKKITATDKDVDALLKTLGDEKTRQHFSQPSQRAYLESIILKRNVIDELTKI